MQVADDVLSAAHEHDATLVRACHVLHSFAHGALQTHMAEWSRVHIKSRPEDVPAAVIELCVTFALMWTLRSMATHLHTEEDEAVLSSRVAAAMRAAGFGKMPEPQDMWRACINPVSADWTTWHHSCVMKHLDIEDGAQTNLLIPTTAVTAQSALASMLLSVGQHVLVLAATETGCQLVHEAMHNSRVATTQEQLIAHCCCNSSSPARTQVCARKLALMQTFLFKCRVLC